MNAPMLVSATALLLGASCVLHCLICACATVSPGRCKSSAVHDGDPWLAEALRRQSARR